MLKLFLLTASALLAQDASMECSNVATAATRALSGPMGSIAVLRVSSADDHAKNSHGCQAKYELLVTPSDGSPPHAVELMSSDAEWGRPLVLHLDGFSEDGKHLFGFLSEGGKFSFVTLFDYDAANDRSKLIQLKSGLTTLARLKCEIGFTVAGITHSGEIVLEPRATDACQGSYRWQVNAAGELQSLRRGETIVRLHGAGAR